MLPSNFSRPFRSPTLSLRFFTLIAVCFLGLGFLSPYDMELSKVALSLNTSPTFLAFMDQSVFQGKAFGASDIPLLLHLIAFLLYVAACLPGTPAGLQKARSALALLWMSGLLTGIGVHLFKAILARPRPYMVMEAAAGYRHFFELPWPLQVAFLKGSFPSGHTASMMTLWSALLIWRHHQPDAVWRHRVLGLVCMVLALAMAFSRVAQGAHWPTDTLGAMVFAVCVSTWLGALLLHHEPQAPTQELGLALKGLLVWFLLGLATVAIRGMMQLRA